MFVTRSRIFSCFLFVVVIESVEQTSFDTFVFFGDSNTDTVQVSNLTNGQWPPSPPYWKGRASDGPIWVDRLTVGTSINYAYSAATTDNNLIRGYTGPNGDIPVPGVRQQIEIFRNRTDLSKMNFGRTLFFIWAGANDYFFNLTLSPAVVVPSLLNSVNDLIQVGAQHLLIMNQPPLQIVPAAVALNLTAYITSLVLTHNANLSRSIDSLSKKNVRLVDLYSLIGDVLNRTSLYGINNTQSCWQLINASFVPMCSSLNNSLFMDNFHFTSRVHQILADEVQSLIGETSSGARRSSSLNIILFAIVLLLV